jgi:4-amino-4-deoxy-L-arabinose transferase-like glycosyltransferase
MKRIRLITGLILFTAGGISIFAFSYISDIFGFLSADGVMAPVSILRLRVCLMALAPIGIYLIIYNKTLYFLKSVDQIIQSLTQKSFLTVLLSSAFVLRMAVIFFYPFNLWIDYLVYDQLAWDLAQTGCYCIDGIPTAYRPPGYPFFLSVLYSVFGHQPVTGAIANVFIGVVIIIIGYYISARVWSEKVGRWTAFLFTIFPSQILFVNLLASEPLFTALFLMAILIFIPKNISGDLKWYYLLVGGIILGLATLVRPITQLYLILPLVYWYFVTKKPKKVVFYFLIVCMGFALAVAPWMIRNYNTKGKMLISTSAGINLLAGNQPDSGMGWNPTVTEGLPIGDPTREVYVDSLSRSRAIEYILNDPIGFVKRGIMKLGYFYAIDIEPVDYQLLQMAKSGSLDNYIILAVLVEAYYLKILLLALFGLAGCFIYGKYRLKNSLLLWGTVLYWMVVHFIFYAEGRYHFPIIPIIAAFAALQISSRLHGDDSTQEVIRNND